MQRDLNGDGRGPIRGGGPDRAHPPRHFLPHRSLLVVYFREKTGLNLTWNTRETKFNSSDILIFDRRVDSRVLLIRDKPW